MSSSENFVLEEREPTPYAPDPSMLQTNLTDKGAFASIETSKSRCRASATDEIPLMAIETKIQSRQTLQNVGYAVACLAFGIWGWYDYAIKIPRNQAAFEEFITTEEEKSLLEATKALGELTEAQKAQYTAAVAILNKYMEKPVEPAAYDRPVQLWLYIVGCGVLGVPWFAYAQWNLSRRRFRLDDDGTFHCAEGTFTPEQITGIDLSRWMSKAVARVEVSNGPAIVLDDYKYKNVEDIVAALCARFYPGEWTSDARPIGDPKSRDTKRELAEAAAAEALAAEDGTDEARADDESAAKS